MHLAHLRPISLAFVLVSCGPTISLTDEDTGDGSESTTSTSTSTSTSTTSTSTTTATTVSTTITTTGDDTTSDTGFIFLIDPDGGSCTITNDGHWHCFECDLFAQDCPLGEKCMPWANDGGTVWNAHRCSQIDQEPAQPGDECTVEGSGVSGIDSCDLGSMCFHVDPEANVGVCVPFCTGDESNPQCPDGTRCMIANDGQLLLCLPPCDPLAPGACPTLESCVGVDEDPVCVPPGVEPGPCGPTGCGTDGACLDETLLAACMDFECCTPWCDLNAPDPDAPCAAEPMHACQPYYVPGTAPTGLEHLGVCRLPA